MTLAELYKIVDTSKDIYVGQLAYGYMRFELNKNTRKLLYEPVYKIEVRNDAKNKSCLFVTLEPEPCARVVKYRLSELLMNLEDDMDVTIYAWTNVIYKDHTNEELKTFKGKPCKVFREIGKYRGLAALDPYVICIHTDEKTFIEGSVYTVNRYCDK